MSVQLADPELKTRHRAMWAAGDYPLMVETFLLPVGPRLADACELGPGVRVLDVAAGTGNASLPAARTGASVTASDLTPQLLAAGRSTAEAEGLELEWIEADAENLPFEDESFDVVMSAIGVMFAPHHQAAADELVRVCRPGGRIGLLSWTPDGMLGALFATMKPFAPPPPPGAPPPPLWGSEQHVQELFGDRVDFHTLERDVLRDHRLRAGPRVRRALHVVLRADDRGARQRGAQRARDRVRRGAGAVLRATGTAEPPSRRASRRSTCSRSAPGTDAGPDGSRARAGGSRSFALEAADRADSVEHSSSRGRPRDSRPFSLPSPPQVRRVGSRCGGRWHPSTGSRHQPAPPVP